MLAAPAVFQWLEVGRPVRVLFRRPEVLTVADEAGRVVSWVATESGLGPFAAVVPELGRLSRGETVAVGEVRRGHLALGKLRLGLAEASPWEPRVRWSDPGALAEAVTRCELEAEDGDREVLEPLLAALGAHDRGAAEGVVVDLAGRGPGLTPRGDDLLAGVWLALHALGFPAAALAPGLAALAASRTTTLSAAWLHAAARGEAAIGWHVLATAWAGGGGVETALAAVRGWGESSGRAMLGAFAATIRRLAV